MGCGSKTFYDALYCGPQTFNKWFYSNTTYPYFFPVNAKEKKQYPSGMVTQSVQYSFGSPKCDRDVHAQCDLVGLWMSDAATFAQYRYTPFVQTEYNDETGESSGGVFSFEFFWSMYNNAGWYQ